MTTLTASKARARLYRLLDETAKTHEPIQITGKRSNGYLISEEDFRSMEETMYLLSVKGMRESIVKNMKAPVKNFSKKLKW